MCLVVANEQTSGRGRLKRPWYTPRDSALAFSLILRPRPAEEAHPSLLTGLLALALADSLKSLRLLVAIKWPNDVLVYGKKVTGILVESTWSGEVPDTFVLGMGVNVTPASIPPAHLLQYPATSIESACGGQVQREALLDDILQGVIAWRPKLGTERFLKTWEAQLAYRGQPVRIETGQGTAVLGILLGLDSEGGLKLQDENGESMTVQYGDVHLRQVP